MLEYLWPMQRLNRFSFPLESLVHFTIFDHLQLLHLPFELIFALPNLVELLLYHPVTDADLIESVDEHLLGHD